MMQGFDFSRFNALSLQEMDAVALTNRIDTKFAFPLNRLSEVLEDLESKYRILEIDRLKIHPYDTVYFDDEAASLYHAHHAGRGSRFKLRLRNYGSTESTFMEVKRKTNTGRTDKRRKRTDMLRTELTEEQRNFFAQQTGAPGSEWRFSLRVRFSRVTLVSLDPPERVTLDFGLEVDNLNGSMLFNGIVIAEVKQGGKSASAFLSRMKCLRLKPFAVSKYCLGMSMLRPDVKKNNFLPQHRLLKVIQHKTDYGTI